MSVKRKSMKKTLKHKSKSSARKQRGGSSGNTGYTFDQKDSIGGQMARVGYSDCDTPSYYNKFQVYDVPVQSQNVEPQSQIGGKRKRSKRSKRTMKPKRSKRSMKSKRTMKPKRDSFNSYVAVN
jgi:hypothetical protein